MDALTLQVLVLKGVGLPDIFQALDDDMPADSEIPIPTGANLRRDILKILLLRFHPVGRPLVSVVVTAGFVLLEYVGSFPVQRLSKVLQQHL